jgi:hypothetical protein
VGEVTEKESKGGREKEKERLRGNILHISHFDSKK